MVKPMDEFRFDYSVHEGLRPGDVIKFDGLVRKDDAERYASERVAEAVASIRGASKGQPINDAVQAAVDALEDGGNGPRALVVLSLAGLNRLNPRPSVSGLHKDIQIDDSIAPELFRVVPK